VKEKVPELSSLTWDTKNLVSPLFVRRGIGKENHIIVQDVVKSSKKDLQCTTFHETT
jgi:hypothetical protein